jgi:hypothetical protein
MMDITNFDRLERLIHKPLSSRPGWLKIAREDAAEILWLAHRARNNQDFKSLQEFDLQAGLLADGIQYRMDTDL